MSKLVELYIRSCTIGLALSVAFVALIVLLDVGNLRHLVFGSQIGLLALCMMVVFNGIVFAGVQFGIAVMSMAERQDDPPHGRGPRIEPRLVRVTVPVQRRGKGGGNRSSRGDVNFPRA